VDKNYPADAGQLNKLPAKIEEGTYTVPEELDDELKDVLSLVTEAVSSEEEITIKAGKAKAGKAAKKEGGGERKPPQMVKDTFGCKEGSDGSKINAALSKKMQAPAKIAEAAGVTEARARSHLHWMVKHDGGYAGSKHIVVAEGEGKEAKFAKAERS
jgi:hypothetical protein